MKKDDNKLKKDEVKEKSEKKKKEEVNVAKPIAKKLDVEEDKVVRRTNKIILWLLGIISTFILGVIILVLIVPNFTKIPEIKVPDVSGMTIIDAENALKDAGFEVAVETEKEESGEVEKGKIIKTSPIAGRKIKKGTTIILYESLGEEIYVMENFVGENYIEIQTILENVHKLKVTIEKKDVDDLKDIDKQNIIEQSPKEGTKLAEGDEVILYIPKILEGYPDIVGEGWSVDDVEVFCSKYGINLKINYETNEQYSDGMIISQSRAPSTPIVSGTTLKIVVAVTPETGDESSGVPENGEIPD